jgi:hypothetical protein
MTGIDMAVVREGKNLKGRVLGLVLRSIGFLPVAAVSGMANSPGRSPGFAVTQIPIDEGKISALRWSVEKSSARLSAFGQQAEPLNRISV